MDLTKINDLLDANSVLDTQTRLEVDKLVRGAEIMPVAVFWSLVTSLKEDIENSKKRGQDEESGIHNFFCHAQLEAEQALSFINTYRNLSRAISSDEHYDHLSDDGGYFCGDDSWGDLTDSFLLNGKELYESLLNRTIDPKHEVFNDIPEMYIRTRLEEKVRPWLRDLNRYPDDEEVPNAVDMLERELEDAKAMIRSLNRKLEKVQEIVSQG